LTVGWVAAGVRGRGLARRRLGRDGVQSVAAAGSLAGALVTLASTPYGREVRSDMDLASAQHAVSATLLWHLRVLAGWGPPLGAGALRLLGAGFEVANVIGHLARLHDRPAPPPYALGSLATTWPAVVAARSPAQVRRVLSSSAWGDPGGDDPAVVALSLQLGWARRVFDGVPAAADWAVSAAALVIARVLGADALSAVGPSARRDATHVLGRRWQQAGSIGELARHVSGAAGLVLRDVDGPEDRWRAEVRWWTTVESTSATLATHPRPDLSSGIGVAGLLAADAWWTRAALAIAAGGGGDPAEVLDVVA
jgi:hypothetical protein